MLIGSVTPFGHFLSRRRHRTCRRSSARRRSRHIVQTGGLSNNGQHAPVGLDAWFDECATALEQCLLACCVPALLKSSGTPFRYSPLRMSTPGFKSNGAPVCLIPLAGRGSPASAVSGRSTREPLPCSAIRPFSSFVFSSPSHSRPSPCAEFGFVWRWTFRHARPPLFILHTS